MTKNIEEKMVFAVAPARDGQPDTLALGIPTGAWEYMRKGMCHEFDLTKIGINMRLMIYGAADHASALKVIEGVIDGPYSDQRETTDFSFPKKS